MTPSFSFFRGNLLVLTLSGCLGMFSRSMVFPYIPLYILSLGGDPFEVGIVYALGPLGGLLAFPIAGYLADHMNRARLIAVTGYFSAGVILINAVAPSWEWVALARLLHGLAVFNFPATSSIVADSLDPKHRGRGFATMAALTGLPALLAPWVAGSMLDAYGVETGMRILYVAMASAYALGATINLIFIRETRKPSEDPVRLSNLSSTFKSSYTGIPQMLRDFPPSLKALSVIIILCFIANGIASPFWVIFAKTRIGLSSTQWGLVLLVEMTLRNLATIPAGFLADRFGRARFVTGALLSSTALPLFLLAGTFGEVLAIRCIVGLTSAFFSPSTAALLADTVPSPIRGRVMAAIGRGSVMIGAASGGTGGPGTGFLITIPLMLASLAGGILYEWNPVSTWVLVLALMLVALVVAVLYVRDPQKAER